MIKEGAGHIIMVKTCYKEFNGKMYSTLHELVNNEMRMLPSREGRKKKNELKMLPSS
jgi:hypothetical protein